MRPSTSIEKPLEKIKALIPQAPFQNAFMEIATQLSPLTSLAGIYLSFRLQRSLKRVQFLSGYSAVYSALQGAQYCASIQMVRQSYPQEHHVDSLKHKAQF